MAAHQYWRLTGFLTDSNVLELSQAHLYDGTTLIALAPTFTVPPDTGTAFPDVLHWNDCTMSGFALVWNLSTPVASPNLRLGAGSSAANFPKELYCQYSDDGKFWSTNNSPVNILFPGAGTLTPAGQVAVPGDLVLSSVSYLLSFDGANESTTLPNLAPSGITVVMLGSSKLVTSLKRFGSASAYFASSASWIAADGGGPVGNAATIAASVFGTGDYCMEYSVYPSDTGTSRVIASNRVQGGYGWTLYRTLSGALEYQSVGVWGTIRLTSTQSVLPNKWSDICVERYAGTLYLFIDGKIAASAPDTTNMVAADNALILGWQHTGAGTAPWYGYMDALRIGKAARYMGTDYTPANDQFPSVQAIPAEFVAISITPAAKRWRTSASVAEPIVGDEMPAFNLSEFAPQGAFMDAYNGGLGSVYGTVKEKNTPANAPLRRRVVLIDERSRIAIRETWSDAATGNYEFKGVKQGVPYTVLSYDHLHNYRAVAADNLLAEELP